MDLFLKMFIGLLSACTTWRFRASLASNSEGRLKCVSPHNLPCRATAKVVNTNSNGTPFYPSTVSVNKCSGSCNTIDDQFVWVCGPDKVENVTGKVFNLMMWVNETRFLVQHESCECKFGMNESACNPNPILESC